MKKGDEPDDVAATKGQKITRRQAIGYGVAGAAGLYCASNAVHSLWSKLKSNPENAVFRHGAPDEATWSLWKKRGWVREARFSERVDETTVECKLCPNHCLLGHMDRGRCRNRVNYNGKLYTLAYGNPCTFHVDPVEKKPLLHFLPGSTVFSLSTAGCCLRCLNCQNWELSQSTPEQTKNAAGENFRATPENIHALTREDMLRLSMFPEDVVGITEGLRCPSIAYTYGEPISYYEYMYDTATLAHSHRLKNIWITCGHITNEALRDLCPHIDAANVNLKGFDDKTYATLNSGRVQPVLNTLKTLKEHHVWFEVTHLTVPTYTDKPDVIQRMCDWLLTQIGPDYPIHFSRFHPAHKLTHLPSTPSDILLEAREIARRTGLHHVYIGNASEVTDGETTFCPQCHKAIVERTVFSVRHLDVEGGKCRFCGTVIAGVWG